jgi:phage terminase large subunit-like protein
VYNFFVDYYLPIDSISHSSPINFNKELYQQWAANKYLKTTPGNVTDYTYITHDLLVNNENAPIRKVFYDKYNATAWAIQCTEEGLPLEQFGQDFGNFNKPTKEFERLMINEKPDANEHVILDDNPITRFCLRNAVLKMWLNDNVKPVRSNEKNKIDGVIAMIQALAAYLKAAEEYKGINIF